ncbi:hypothetical protein GS504_28385 [Rhodococcus hoagii]|uniref:GIY-YIG nuclease family protein n=1 Tax=Rhodococcus hoagii TaxID=43767 RepID=UPI0011A36FCC|nr:GIY-YIG nuclease family protein [Prescottella equi]NKR29279.1 hypothetical protein [Prescottella equi]NKS61383.1 hypothetical protein [Prescottella equi]NKZ71937.1 hypothetical protein [Prescottella equi]
MAYVYLLCDPRAPSFPGNVFYVGKGTGARADAHRIDAITADVTENAPEKISVLRAIEAAGMTLEIRVIANKDLTGIRDDQAFDIEAALIAVLCLDHLTNKVNGHRLGLFPSEVFAGAKRESADLPDGVRAVHVPVNGVWGGADYAGTMLSAQDDAVWDNARRTWSPFAQWRSATISDSAGTPDPVLLLALAKDPAGHARNVVVGVFELSHVYQSADPNDRKGGFRKDGTPVPEYPGWVFERTSVNAETTLTAETRDALLGRQLTLDGAPVERRQDRSYLGNWN